MPLPLAPLGCSLLTHVDPVANTPAVLECLGTPTIGRGLELRGRNMPTGCSGPAIFASPILAFNAS